MGFRTMKTIILIRHAKSSWGSPTLQDFDRPLNERGLHDAPIMAKRLHERIPSIDAFITSPAKRALTTATFFAAEFNKKNEIIQLPKLYEPTVNVFYQVIQNADNNWDTIALFAHNPGISEFVNELTSTRIDNMPTCGIFVVNPETDDWQSFKKANKKFSFFDSPKSPVD